jgi:NTE family protein
MNTTPSSSHQRALVFGGGGSAGNAWEIGVIAGLFDAGLDVTDADLLIGTSAGATVAVQVSVTPPAELLAAILDAPPHARPVPSGSGRVGAAPPVANHLGTMGEIIAGARDASDMRRRMAAAVLERDTASDPSAQSQRRDIVAARLPTQTWPQRTILITAVDAVSGEPVVFDRDSGVDLADAITASTANGFTVPPHSIGANRYIDGGYRRNENADLATGYERVLVLSPFAGRTLHPLEWGMQLAAQIEELRASGSRVETIFPDERSLAAFGGNMMDLAARPPAARAGYELGKSLADELAEFWR